MSAPAAAPTADTTWRATAGTVSPGVRVWWRGAWHRVAEIETTGEGLVVLVFQRGRGRSRPMGPGEILAAAA